MLVRNTRAALPGSPIRLNIGLSHPAMNSRIPVYLRSVTARDTGIIIDKRNLAVLNAGDIADLTHL
jgi:hypothetical protein